MKQKSRLQLTWITSKGSFYFILGSEHVSLGAEDQPISATTKQRIDLDDKLLRSLAKNIGKDWKQLGTELGFKAAEIQTFEYNCKDNLNEQAFQMFVAWRRKQTNDNEAKGKLAEALDTIGRADMASEISGKTTKYFKFIRIVTQRGKFKI